MDIWFRMWCSQDNHFSWVYLVKLPFLSLFVDDSDTTENGPEAVFKHLLWTSSSDTVNLLNYSVVDISKSPYLLCILKNPLKPKQSTTSLALSGKVTILGSSASGERGGGGTGWGLLFQHGVACRNNLGTDKYTGFLLATLTLSDHHCSVEGSNFLEFIVTLIFKYKE